MLYTKITLGQAIAIALLSAIGKTTMFLVNCIFKLIEWLIIGIIRLIKGE